MTDDEILALTLTEAADAVARGEVTSVQLTRAAIARTAKLGRALNCIAALDADEALLAAEKADRDSKRGKSAGPLNGVPLAHKDLFYRRGKVVACGSKIRKDFVAETTATVLERLSAAGAVNLGALHMAEFAFSPTGYNEHYGHARNPWNTAHVPGGSSSGSGAAVAARIVFGSLGTDTGGSLRHPAAMCGLTGLKPTLTRVSRAGVMPLSHSLDCVGPLARTARDCARLLEIVAGADAADPTAADVPVPRYEAALDGNARGLRIGVPNAYYYDAVDSEIRMHLDDSLSALRGLGAEVVKVDVLHLPAIPIPVPTIDETTCGNAADIARIVGVIGHCTRGINYLGLPAISVPAGFDAKGLPIAFQLVGRPFAESSLLRAADAYQSATTWHRQSPDLAAVTGV
jgi:aspartyl-tRNA(Asn)/glutamyl-tRNA(Gln) amidotransferase subunit A